MAVIEEVGAGLLRDVGRRIVQVEEELEMRLSANEAEAIWSFRAKKGRTYSQAGVGR